MDDSANGDEKYFNLPIQFNSLLSVVQSTLRSAIGNIYNVRIGQLSYITDVGWKIVSINTTGDVTTNNFNFKHDNYNYGAFIIAICI